MCISLEGWIGVTLGFFIGILFITSKSTQLQMKLCSSNQPIDDLKDLIKLAISESDTSIAFENLSDNSYM